MSLMEKLTKPIGAPKTSGEAKRRTAVPTDVVGVELGGGDPRGCPAVRLVHRPGKSWAVRAVGFVPPPNVAIPTSWKELDRQPTWSLPAAFAAPYAALAVNSPDQVVRQTTLETLSDDGTKIERGAPVSKGGLRFAVEPMGEASFVLESGIPEFQALWLSRLLPEGRRPTACSVQTSATAMLASLVEQPEFNAVGGNAAALFVSGDAIWFVGFRGGVPVLFREFQGMGGGVKIREALKGGFGMDEKMMDEVLDDTLIDPSPILAPILNPILRQMELSLDYLRSRQGVAVEKVFLMGLTSGARHWSKMSESMLNVKLTSPDLFDGVELPGRLDEATTALLKRSHVFMTAYGAARAAMEDAE